MSNESTQAAGRCYRDYVIVDGQFVGRFEEMYQDVTDPWGCTADVDALPNRILLELLREASACRTILDVGCGLGALSERIYHTCRPAEMQACDVSPTAIAKAKQRAPHINFFVHDLLTNPVLPLRSGSVDLIVMSEVVWYILPVLSDVFWDFTRLMTRCGAVVLKQAFYQPGKQQYGNEVVSCPEDLMKYLAAGGLVADRQVTIVNQTGNPTWVCRAVRP